MSVKEDIHIRVDEDVMGAVRAYAASHGISLAAAVSVLLRRALKGERQ
jgi:plasmid stability protein